MASLDTVVLTRESADNEPLARRLRGRGLTVVDYPCVATEYPQDALPADGPEVWRAYAAIVFTSKRGVQGAAGMRQAVLAGRLVAAVGRGTGRALAETLGRTPDVVGPDGTGESLAAALVPRLRAGERVLYVRGDKSTGTLRRGLEAAGIVVEEVVVYRNVAPPLEPLAWGGEVVVAVASPSAARRFFAQHAGWQSRVRAAAIGPTTAAALEALGVNRIGTATQPDIDHFEECIVSLLEREE